MKQSLELAKQVVDENPGDAFDDKALRLKRRQLAITEFVLDKASTDGNRPITEPGKESVVCCVESIVNSTLGLVLGKPSIELEGTPHSPGIGFSN